MRRGACLGLFALGAVGALALSGCSSAASGPTTCDLSSVAPDHCVDAHAMALPAELPAARGNQYGDDLGAAELGFDLFFDSNLGSGVSCATCHSPELAFVDRKPVSVVKGGQLKGTRNAPTTFNAAHLNVFFWDGRADSLWSQALGPLENPVEQNTSRLALAHVIDAKYKASYESVFGALPDVSSWPATGKPGDAAFDALPSDEQDQVNRFFSNIGKSLEAYMRKNATSRAPLDAFLAGDSEQLSAPAQHGLEVFLAQGCQSCHSGPMLTDERFHEVGFPSLPGAAPDSGRAGGIPKLQQDIFNLAGPYADPVPAGAKVSMPSVGAGDMGAFRTPSLRNVSKTFPYGHDGALPSLSDVIALHAPGLSAEDQADLLVFFQALNGNYPLPPWNNWPSPQ